MNLDGLSQIMPSCYIYVSLVNQDPGFHKYNWLNDNKTKRKLLNDKGFFKIKIPTTMKTLHTIKKHQTLSNDAHEASLYVLDQKLNQKVKIQIQM